MLTCNYVGLWVGPEDELSKDSLGWIVPTTLSQQPLLSWSLTLFVWSPLWRPGLGLHHLQKLIHHFPYRLPYLLCGRLRAKYCTHWDKQSQHWQFGTVRISPQHSGRKIYFYILSFTCFTLKFWNNFFNDKQNLFMWLLIQSFFFNRLSSL